MKTIGILPAAGSASRLLGLPKFLLPISESETLVQWHVRQMSKVCDVVKINTREIFLPMLNDLKFEGNVELFVKEPSTINDAINNLMDEEACYIVGLPDTYSDVNMYENLVRSNPGFTLAIFDCPKDMIGHVGQVKISNGIVIDVQDKNPQCNYKYMWGAFSMVGNLLDSNNVTPSIDFKDSKADVVYCDGIYIDAGTFEGYLKLAESLV